MTHQPQAASLKLYAE